MPNHSLPPFRQTFGLVLLIVFATTSLLLSELSSGVLRTSLILAIAACMALTILEAFIELSRRQSGATLAMVLATLAVMIMVFFVVFDVGTRTSASTVIWNHFPRP